MMGRPSTKTSQRQLWGTFIAIFFSYVCYTLNRKSVPFILPVLISRGLPKDVAGSINSSQNLAYTVSKFMIGILSDRMSARFLLILGLFLSGWTAILFTFFDSPLVYIALWFCNGLLQGCGWPACTKIIREKYPPTLFGTLWSILSASINIAGLINAAVSTYIVLNYGWKVSLIFSGAVSILMSVICFVVISDENTHGKIQEKNKNANFKTEKQESWKYLFNYPMIWLVAFCDLVAFCAKTCCTDWAQLYLIEDLEFSQITASMFLGSLEIGGFVGSLSAGYLSDWIIKFKTKSNGKSSGNYRVLIAIGFMAVMNIALHIFCFFTSFEASRIFISTLGFVLGASLYGPITIHGIVACESVPSHLSGTAHAIVALFANIGGIIAGLPFTMISKAYSWWAVFMILEILSVLTVFLMLFNYKLWLPKEEHQKHLKSS